MQFLNPSNLTFAVITFGQMPSDGPKTVPLNLDFTSASSIGIDLTSQTARKMISLIQGMFIDNSGGAGALTITINETGQQIKIPAGYQAYVSVLAPRDFKATFDGPAINSVIPVQLLNVPVSNMIWKVN